MENKHYTAASRKQFQQQSEIPTTPADQDRAVILLANHSQIQPSFIMRLLIACSRRCNSEPTLKAIQGKKMAKLVFLLYLCCGGVNSTGDGKLDLMYQQKELDIAQHIVQHSCWFTAHCRHLCFPQGALHKGLGPD